MLPTKDETVQTTKNYYDFKLDFWFLHSIEYLYGLLNIKAQKLTSFGLQGNLNARKRTIQGNLCARKRTIQGNLNARKGTTRKLECKNTD